VYPDLSKNPSGKQRIWAIGGGKGGVGKSLVAANFAIVLANLGKKVVAIDLDLGNANLHNGFGIRYPRKTLMDFINGSVGDLKEILLDTSIYNLKFIGGAGGVVGSANPFHTQKLKLIRCLKKIQADHVVLDLGAGTSYATIDFFLNATDHIIVTTPETPSIQSAYNFIRICVFRKLYASMNRSSNAWELLEKAKIPFANEKISGINDLFGDIEKSDPENLKEFKTFQKSFKPNLIVNMILKNEENRVGLGIRDIVKRYLDVDIQDVGSISFDKIIRESVIMETPFLINAPNSRPTNEFLSLSARILTNNTDGAGLKDIMQREIKKTSNTFSRRVVQSRSLEVDPSIYLVDRIKNGDDGSRKEPSGFFGMKSGSWSKIAIDLGTANTRIFVNGRSIVLDEPSCMSIDENSGGIVALGHESRAMLGRSHTGISIVTPMEAGIISNYTDVKKMINEFLRVAKRSTILIRPGFILTIPSGLTNVEKRAFVEFIKDLGAREVHLVYEPLAAAIGAGLPVDMPSASMLVNFGAGSTSASIISLGGIVTSSSQRIGGITIDTAIIRYYREKHNFLIGDLTAEWIKIHYGQASKIMKDKKFQIRGQHLAEGIPRTLDTSTEEVREAVAKTVDDMVMVILHLLEKVPPELSSDLVNTGMTLSGGGAYLAGLDSLIRERTGLKTSIALNAQTAAVEGIGRMLDDFRSYSKFFADVNETETK
jgi:rod shape-determining protein MreB and related proteins